MIDGYYGRPVSFDSGRPPAAIGLKPTLSPVSNDSNPEVNAGVRDTRADADVICHQS
jgi:hypothetical protein